MVYKGTGNKCRQFGAMDSQCRNYFHYYNSQLGGDLSVFRGTRYQEGSGIGDFFKGLWKFVSPIVGSAAKTLVTSAGSNLSSGANWKEAAKSAIIPTLASGIGALAEKLDKKQAGGGRRRKRRHPAVTPQAGGKRRRRTGVYKGKKRHRKRHHKTKKHQRFNF